MDLSAGRARAGAAELRAAAGDPPAQGSDAASQGAEQRADPGDPKAREGAPGCRDQAHERRLADILEVRAGDARSAPVRGERARRAGRAREGKDALEDPAASRGLGEPVRRSHHGIMVAQLLAHIDTLEAAVGLLDEKIEAMLAPHAKVVELLCTIPGSRSERRRY